MHEPPKQCVYKLPVYSENRPQRSKKKQYFLHTQSSTHVHKLRNPIEKTCPYAWNPEVEWPVNSVNHLVLFSVKTNCPNIYKRPTRFAIFRADSINICKLHTCFLGDKMESHNFYKPLTGFAVVKTDSPNINKPPTSFPVVKQTLRTSITLQHVLW